MSDLKYIIGICVVSWLMLSVSGALAVEQWRLVDNRICYNNPKNADGSYKRSRAVLQAYADIVPCPSTGEHAISCPDNSIDHVRPLSRCGCDSVDNVQWLKNSIKSCAGTECKDRWELKVYSCNQGK